MNCMMSCLDAIDQSGVSRQSGYDWDCTVEQYESLREAAAEGLFRGHYATPEEALRGEAIRMGIAKESDF